MKPCITRFAPSPTGPPHLGSLRTAYQNWLAARSTGGKFILRIDDTDLNRSDKAYTDMIFSMMDHFGLDYDQIIYQSERNLIYHKYVQDMLDRHLAVRLDDGAVVVSDHMRNIDTWTDGIAGNIKISSDDYINAIGRVLIKSDGSPAYNFASVVDDIDLDINCIIRGKDHTTNTSFQVMLFYAMMVCNLPNFYHIGLIMKDGKKLSKRDNEADLSIMIDNYHPDAILNCVIRLGWSPTVDDKSTAVLTKNKMLDMIWDSGKFKNKNANLDMVKLKSWDRKYKALQAKR